MKPLRVLINGCLAGTALMDRHGRIHFEYDSTWTRDGMAIPLSLSLPLARSRHRTSTVAAVLWGLLPDNEYTLQRWGQQFHVSPGNPLALLAHVGEDCAGAAQFVHPDRLPDVRDGANDGVEWLDEAGVADRLRRVKEDHSATRRSGDPGQFSLPGAQPKLALLHDNDRWGIPGGRTPTTHILKPPTGAWEGLVQNEHFCLSLARQLGLAACESTILRFEDEITIALTRYDRTCQGGRWWRVHQEDCCQALGVLPHAKYQNDGGPGPVRINALLRTYSSRPETDRWEFFRALIFNWLIGGTDGHAKNYSVLLGERGEVRLAPLYDLSSALAYPDLDEHKLKLAMKVGRHYRRYQVRIHDWDKLGESMGFEKDEVRAALRQVSERVADAAVSVAGHMRSHGLTHPVLDQLTDAIARSAKRASQMLQATRNAERHHRQ